MRQSAKLKAAQDILDMLLFGEMSSKKIVSWGRNNRFAGSKDRRHIRDIVYHCLRNKSYFSYPWRDDNTPISGRKLILSYWFKELTTVLPIANEDFFGTQSFDFPHISDSEKRVLMEKSVPRQDLKESNIKYSYPLFLDKEIKISLEDNFDKVMNLFLSRAQVFIRANKIKISTIDLINSLKNEGFDIRCVCNETEIIRVLNPLNRIKLSPLYSDGFFEFQDLGSQKVTSMLPVNEGMSILDFCAGAGGKSLALASSYKNNLNLNAYDHEKSRLKSFKFRSKRASAKIKFLNDFSFVLNELNLLFSPAIKSYLAKKYG